jgi:tetraacyldisaccharide 4'-kinase
VSLLYRALVRIRRLLYRVGVFRTQRLPCPVLVVGNVVVGGAGKTPTVIHLVRHLRERGWTPGIVSRGHGRQGDTCTEVHAHSDSQEVGDEPALIAQTTRAPMVVGRQRAAAAQLLLDRHPEVDIIVSDDGMQHWALARDLTVVVFDERGCGNGWLLPAGLLREPWPAPALGCEPLLVLQTQRPDAVPQALPPGPCPTHPAHRTLSDRLHNPAGHETSLQSLAATQGHTLGALAGIAQPQRFFDMLGAHGVALAHTLALPDHASTEQLLQAWAALPEGVTWLCTEKDAVKLFPALRHRVPAPSVWAVALEQRPVPAFWAALDAALEGLSSRHGRQTP